MIVLQNPFEFEEPLFPRGFDPEKFLADIEEPPMFLSAPAPEYLAIVKTLAEYL